MARLAPLADGGDMGKWGTFILFVWLLFGAAAAGQRGYYSTPTFGCTQAATIAVTIVAGPLNYFGLDPVITCSAPKPSGA
jgi:hypothetical protein